MSETIKIYDKLIEETMSLVQGGSEFLYNCDEVCRSTQRGELLLSRDSAFELGGSSFPAVNMTLFCSDEKMNDSVILLGKDIPEVSGDTPYARVAIVSLDEGVLPDEDGLYRTLKDIEFVKYRFYPEGCLLRLSPESRREQIRVSKSAVSQGLSLKNIGFGFIEKYKKNPAVKAVKIIFITEKDFEYKKLRAMSEKAFRITESLNRIFDGLEIDCHSCELKAICDEVEGMRDLHFGKGNKKQ